MHIFTTGHIDYNQITSPDYKWLGGTFMKKLWICLLAIFLLTGCKEEQTYETISDSIPTPEKAPMLEMVVQLPDEAGSPVLSSQDAGKLYVCDDYTLTMHTTPAGDLNSTLTDITGFKKEDLQIMESNWQGLKRYQVIWTAAGEEQTQLGRACILSDGNYYYVLTAMAPESKVGELMHNQWQEIFSSFRATEPQNIVNSGS